MAKLPPLYFSHSQKVCALYKKALRSVFNHHGHDVPEWRYMTAVVRGRFDKNKNVKDPRLAKHLLAEGEAEWKRTRHPDPVIFMTSPGGLAYDRYENVSDIYLDYWHPWEKARYPKYFALREQRKKEYIEFYQREYMTKKNETMKNIGGKSNSNT